MAVPLIVMGVAAAAQAGFSMAAASNEADARRKQAQFNSMISEFNAKILDFQAEDVLRIGEDDAQSHLKQAGQMRGSQRSALAAQGIEVDSGSAAEIQEETTVNAKMDARKIRNNALRQQFGYKTQAMQNRLEAKYGMEAGENAARGTMLAGYASMAGGVKGMAGAFSGGGGGGGGTKVGAPTSAVRMTVPNTRYA